MTQLDEIACREILEKDPGNPEALYSLGMIAHQQGQNETALDLIDRALRANPAFAAAFNGLGEVLTSLGRLAQAEIAYRRAVEAGPDLVEAHVNLGNVLMALGRTSDALAAYDRAVTLKPDFAQGHYNIGVAYHSHGRLGDAIACYRAALSLDPQFVPAHYNLGVALQSLQEFEAAAASYRSLLALSPGHVQARYNLANALASLSQYADAIATFDEVLALEPDNADALCNRSVAYWELKRYGEAESSCRRALDVRPDKLDALLNLGNILKDQGRLEEALAVYQKAIEVAPEFVSGHFNIGVALQTQGRLEEAIASYQKALALDPGFVMAHYNMGVALQSLKKPAEAGASYRRVLELSPQHAEAHNNLANSLAGQGFYREALDGYDAALRIRPDYSDALYNRGNALWELRRFEEAVACYDRALAIKPDYASAAYNRGIALNDLGRREEALESLERALALKPDYIEARSLRVHGRQHLCLWPGLERDSDALRQLVSGEASGRVPPFQFLALPNSTAAEQLACARQFGQAGLGDFLSRTPLWNEGMRRSGGRIRVGYLSADFREHAVSYLVAEIIELHDRGRFEVFGYSYGYDDRSAMRARMRAAFDTFRDISQCTHEAAAKQVLDDRIDILVDLMGYTTSTRLQIPAQRPAPVQVNWLGYPGTVGVPGLADYIIGDPIVTPLAHASHFSEALALMPHCYQSNDRRRVVAPRPSRKQAGLPPEGFVFCCFNQTSKITPEVFDLWCRLLEAVPGSCLWLLVQSPVVQDNLRKEALARGVAPERLVFAPRLSVAEHLGRLQLADLALDTYPYTSHTTASDALWVGVPLVTRIGETFAGRVAASILSAACVPELITESPQACYELALDLATRPARLGEIRSRLVATRSTCPLFDSERFARDLERIYQRMWADSCAGVRTPIQPDMRDRDARNG